MKIFRFRGIFPQISRFFSAKKTRRKLAAIGTLLLWTGILGLFALNHRGKTTWKKETYIPVKELLTHPFSWNTHALLADKLWAEGLRGTAKKELAIARDLWKPDANSGSVLGATTSPDDLLAQWENTEHTMRTNLRFWQQLMKDKPGYLDGHIMVAQLAYDLGETDIAKTHLVIANTLDSNNDTVIRLTKLLK